MLSKAAQPLIDLLLIIDGLLAGWLCALCFVDFWKIKLCACLLGCMKGIHSSSRKNH